MPVPEFNGLSESAFERLLIKEDILVNRLLNYPNVLKKTVWSTFKEHIQKFRLEEKRIIQEKLEILRKKIKLKDQIIDGKERTIILQQKLIEELEKNRK